MKDDFNDDTVYEDNPRKLSAWDDKYEDMTFGRRLARKLSEKYTWYFPGKALLEQYENASNKEDDDPRTSTKTVPPSLDSAWAYFEHFVLPRYYADVQNKHESQNGRSRFVDELQRSDPGEMGRPTKLYPIWKTSENDLGDFGIGIGLYFYTLKSIAFILFVAGCLNIVNMVDFSSCSYVSDAQESIIHSYLKGSAICTDRSWQACPDCDKSDWDTAIRGEGARYAETEGDNPLKFVLVNNCTIGKTLAVMSVVTICFILLGMLVLNYILKKKSVQFDESVQSAQDYSIVVSNPPPDARDPHEWKTFFESVAPDVHVTLCTIALNNEELLLALIKRRKLLLQIENQLPPEVTFDVENLSDLIQHCPPRTWMQRYLFFAKSAESIYLEIKQINEQVDELSKKDYDCCDVYITFESEQAQRHVLETMTTSIRSANTQTIPSDFPTNCLFRQNYLLRVSEPDEPSSIRWMDLNESDLIRLIQRAGTFFLSFCLLALCAISIFFARKRSAFAASITITCFNQITPITVKYLNRFEAHASQSSYEASQFIKITLFRWVNTAIVTQLITPFTDTIQNEASLINSIFMIFLTEMTVNPILQMSNYMSNINMHLLAPRAVDQRRMNLYFQGAYYEIGERYTAMTKILFFTLFYCTIFPLGFFFATTILIITYWTDKYSLLRTWKAAPLIGPEVSDFTRKFFFPSAILVYAIMGSYQYSSFPFDNACVTDKNVPEEYTTQEFYKATILTGADILIKKFEPDSFAYKRCSQDNLNPLSVITGMEKHDRMSSNQENVSELYGWFSFVVICVVGSLTLIANFKTMKSYFFKVYKPSGEPTDKKLSEQQDVIDGYIPQINIAGTAFPKLMCNIDGLDKGLIGWVDPDHEYDHHNMIFDVPEFAQKIYNKRSSEGTQRDEERIDMNLFSTVTHWAPEGIQS